MPYGEAIRDAVDLLREHRSIWDHDRGFGCGLIAGDDGPVGYVGIPDEFRPFLAWGVDGVHEGLWIDAPDQEHAPYVVMVSPMDTDAIRVEARDARRWLDLLRLGDFKDHWDAWEAERTAAVTQRALVGLPPIPTTYEIPPGWSP